MAYDDASVDAAVPTTGAQPGRVNTNILLKELSGSGVTDGWVWTVQADGSAAFEAPSADLSVATYDPAGVAEQVVGLTAVQHIAGKTIYSPLDAGLTFSSNGAALDLSVVTAPRPIIPVTVDGSPIASVTPPDWSTGHPAGHEVAFVLRLRRGTSDVVITDVGAHADVTLQGSAPVVPAGLGLDLLFWSENGSTWSVVGRPLQTGADVALVSGTAGTNGNLLAWNSDGDAVDAGAAVSGLQPVDADLTALAGVSTAGLLARTGAGTAAARSIAAGSNLGVTNADGVAGNPTVSMADMAQATVKGRAASAGTGAPVNLTAAQVNAIVATAGLPLGGQLVDGNLVLPVSRGATSGQPTLADSGRYILADASGTLVIPNTSVNGAFFHAFIEAFGASTLTFNGIVTAALTAGDCVSVIVRSSTVVKAIRVSAADLLTFS